MLGESSEGPTDGVLKGSLARFRPQQPTEEGVLHGKVLDKLRRNEHAAEIAKFQSVLVPGSYSLTYDVEATTVMAKNGTESVDVSSLLTPGSPIIRHFPKGHPEGSTIAWEVVNVMAPQKEGMPPRVNLKRVDDAAPLSTRLDRLSEIDDTGKWWEMPIPEIPTE